MSISVRIEYRDEYGTYTFEQVSGWIRSLGWTGDIPENPREARELHKQLESSRPASSKQLSFLADLGYRGDAPKTMLEASRLIGKQKLRQEAASKDGYPATQAQIEFLEEIVRRIGDSRNIRALKLSCGAAMLLIDDLLPQFNEAKEREQQERHEAWLANQQAKREEGIQKLRERFVKSLDKFNAENTGVAGKKKPAVDPIMAVRIINKVDCPCANKPNEFILLESVANTLPPYPECSSDCKLGCRLEGVRVSQF